MKAIHNEYNNNSSCNLATILNEGIKSVHGNYIMTDQPPDEGRGWQSGSPGSAPSSSLATPALAPGVPEKCGVLSTAAVPATSAFSVKVELITLF